MSIEKERAKRRQIAAQNNNAARAVKETIPEQEKKRKAQSRDTVGEKVGVSGKTAEQSAFCVRVMDALDQIGKTVEAHQVRQLLRKNVNKAHRLALEGTGADYSSSTGTIS